MTDQLPEIEVLLAKAGPGWSRLDALSPDTIDWMVGEIKRLRRFEAMWEDCRQHRDRAEARARRYMEMVQQVAAIVAPDEEGAFYHPLRPRPAGQVGQRPVALSDWIARALEFAGSGQVDGDHHKAWAIDQMVRALLGCPIITRTATDYRGEIYRYEAQGESEEYRRFVARYRAGEDGPATYSWDEGIPP